MRHHTHNLRHKINAVFLLLLCLAGPAWGGLKVHAIFGSNMVIQRDKPIKVWGWAEPGEGVHVQLGELAAMAETNAQGRWEVTLSAQSANTTPQTLVVNTRSEKIEYDNILIGDVWVMNGQSNMAWGLGKTLEADLETAQANLPHVRLFGISPNEKDDLQSDIPEQVIDTGGWLVCSPETAPQISAIGFAFASRVQRATGVPIGVIDNARGGASIESLVPEHMFDDHPLAQLYYEHVLQRQAEFSIEDWLAAQVTKWEQRVERDRANGVAENRLPARPTAASIRSWNIPGVSPSDAASCYNGMFGVFIGYNIKGVLFHQGYNNAQLSGCRPQRYRVLMKLMVQGWRQDFNDAELPVGIIGFCAGGIPQNDQNFESWTVSGGAYIREAQRLGLADVGDPENTAFLPAFDVQIPGLHPSKKRDHGERAARWALNRVYGMNVHWQTASLVDSEVLGDEIVLTFDQPVMPHDMSTIPQGFAIAGEDGRFYRAHARFRVKKDQGIWNTANKSFDTTIIHLWSPMVPEPVAARYAWANSPQANLYVQGKPWAPLASFRTDAWHWPESEDPTVSAIDRGQVRELNNQAQQRNAERRQREAQLAVEVLERVEQLGKPGASQ
ncbi:MAG: sialate O-acetylesterase [Planctomycetota bacterium]